MKTPIKKAIVLLSGGLDSTTCLAFAKSQGYQCTALSFSYGQKQSSELEAAKRIAQQFQITDHKIFTIPIGQITGSALTDSEVNIPDHNISAKNIPTTYVPARNTIFLSIALGLAEVKEAQAIFIGANAVDYSGYPDCRPEYLEAFTKMANLATQASIEGQKITIETPLLMLTKAEIIKLGDSLGINYADTVSCYRADTNGFACGKCDSCHYRKKGFEEAGIKDPTCYQ